jgi:hypothetical protein
MQSFDIFQIVTVKINAHINADSDKHGLVNMKVFASRLSQVHIFNLRVLQLPSKLRVNTTSYVREVTEVPLPWKADLMVLEPCGEFPSLRAAIGSRSAKIGCVPQTLHKWEPRRRIGLGFAAIRRRIKP